MKTKNFIEKAEELGFKVIEKSSLLIVSEPNLLSEVITVRTDRRYHLDSRWDHSALDKEILEKLLNYTVSYAKTPVEEREEEKKYIYKFPFNVIYETKKDLYVFKILDGGLNLSNAAVHDPEINSRYHFTDKEVEKFTGKDRALFNVCEKIEVTP